MEKITKKVEIIIGTSIIIFTILYNILADTFVENYSIVYYQIYTIIISIIYSITLLIARKQERRLFILFSLYLLALIISITLV